MDLLSPSVHAPRMPTLDLNPRKLPAGAASAGNPAAFHADPVSDAAADAADPSGMMRRLHLAASSGASHGALKLDDCAWGACGGRAVAFQGSAGSRDPSTHHYSSRSSPLLAFETRSSGGRHGTPGPAATPAASTHAPAWADDSGRGLDALLRLSKRARSPDADTAHAHAHGLLGADPLPSFGNLLADPFAPLSLHTVAAPYVTGQQLLQHQHSHAGAAPRAALHLDGAIADRAALRVVQRRRIAQPSLFVGLGAGSDGGGGPGAGAGGLLSPHAHHNHHHRLASASAVHLGARQQLPGQQQQQQQRPRSICALPREPDVGGAFGREPAPHSAPNSGPTATASVDPFALPAWQQQQPPCREPSGDLLSPAGHHSAVFGADERTSASGIAAAGAHGRGWVAMLKSEELYATPVGKRASSSSGGAAGAAGAGRVASWVHQADALDASPVGKGGTSGSGRRAAGWIPRVEDLEASPIGKGVRRGGAAADALAAAAAAAAAATDSPGSAGSSASSKRERLQTTRLFGDEAVIQQETLLHVITQPGAASRDVHELFTIWRPENKCKSVKLQHFTPKQHDILYALAGCEDVMFMIKPVTLEVRDALLRLYGIGKADLQSWFKNRERKARPSKAARSRAAAANSSRGGAIGSRSGGKDMEAEEEEDEDAGSGYSDFDAATPPRNVGSGAATPGSAARRRRLSDWGDYATDSVVPAAGGSAGGAAPCPALGKGARHLAHVTEGGRTSFSSPGHASGAGTGFVGGPSPASPPPATRLLARAATAASAQLPLPPLSELPTAAAAGCVAGGGAPLAQRSRFLADLHRIAASQPQLPQQQPDDAPCEQQQQPPGSGRGGAVGAWAAFGQRLDRAMQAGSIDSSNTSTHVLTPPPPLQWDLPGGAAAGAGPQFLGGGAGRGGAPVRMLHALSAPVQWSAYHQQPHHLSDATPSPVDETLLGWLGPDAPAVDSDVAARVAGPSAAAAASRAGGGGFMPLDDLLLPSGGGAALGLAQMSLEGPLQQPGRGSPRNSGGRHRLGGPPLFAPTACAGVPLSVGGAAAAGPELLEGGMTLLDDMDLEDADGLRHLFDGDEE